MQGTMADTAASAAKQESNLKDPIPTLVEIVRQTGRIESCLTTRKFHDNEENLIENLLCAAAQFFRGVPAAEADLLAQSLKDGVMLEKLAVRLQQEIVSKK